MSKFFRRMAAIILSLAVVSSLFACAPVSMEKSAKVQHTKFLSSLSAIYKKYDTDMDERDKSDTLALNRLMVSGFSGETYGAADYAYDEQNDFAVLQYATREQAQLALAQFRREGVVAEGDSIAVLDGAEKGTICPAASEKIGTPAYIRNYGMAYDDIIVAVIDTGVMYDHPVIQNRFLNHGIDLTSDECEDAYYDTQLETDYYGHATFVSGIIADNTPDNVKILPYKAVAFGASSAAASCVIAGIYDAVDAGASVISISLSNVGAEQSYQKAVDYALANGVCICASAGNNATECTAYPASCEGVITVSALNGDELASFSNYGEAVDFAAPGYRVRSTYVGAKGASYGTSSGTSFSTPYLSAVCADIKSINKSLSKDEVYDTICDFAVDLGDEGYDIYFGNGVPDLSDMVYTDGENYEYRIPQGTLNITGMQNYTADTQPWKRFADKLVSVTVDESITAIGDYAFYNMPSADFEMADTYSSVGTYAFYGCQKVTHFDFDMDVEYVGKGAFGNIENMTVSGYRNTAAEEYALGEGIPFTALGCCHDYIYEVFEPTDTEDGYTLYTCTVCGESYRDDYITPLVLQSGKCGENLTYRLYDYGKLAIDGSGAMYDYMNTPAPWAEYNSQIYILDIGAEVESISPFAFYGNTLAKIYCASGNAFMASDTVNLTAPATGELLLTCARGEYTLPDTVTALSAPAFFTAGVFTLIPNTHFSAEKGIVYDTQGNIVMALPSYYSETLTLDKNITMKEYAFILTDKPDVLDTKKFSIVFEPYSIGYQYCGTMQKRDIVFRICNDSTAKAYAEENGFTIDGYDLGRCGDDLYWTYDETANKITIGGSGDMYPYASLDEIPWRDYLETVKSAVIGSNVTSVAEYAFYNAEKLNSLTLPLSVKPWENLTTWYNCVNIRTMNLLLGSGYMYDYVQDDGTLLYTYTPWYQSRKSITNFHMSNMVKYIGKQAFRNCLAIKELTLSECEAVGSEAFLACSELKTLTCLSKDTTFGDYAVFSYLVGTKYGYYSSRSISAYSDSDAHDYCTLCGASFTSLGCGHSRNVTVLSENTECCTSELLYHCNDCEEEFTELVVPEHAGHRLSVQLFSTNGMPIANAAVALEGTASAVTDENGTAQFNGILCGDYTLSAFAHGTLLISGAVSVDKSDSDYRLTVRYADYVADGAVNAKDYAYALHHGFDDALLFDYGIVDASDNQIQRTE